MIHQAEKHELKICTRCQREFTCKVGDVANCQCSTVKLSEAEQKHLSEKYTDCLCHHCMRAEQHEYVVKQFNDKLRRILRIE